MRFKVSSLSDFLCGFGGMAGGTRGFALLLLLLSELDVPVLAVSASALGGKAQEPLPSY